jgi:hypothetical protein
LQFSDELVGQLSNAADKLAKLAVTRDMALLQSEMQTALNEIRSRPI